MKMTPEQKAFYEYGQEIRNLHFLLKRMRLSSRKDFGVSYKYLSYSEKTILKRDYFLAGRIEKVRQKRAACRAWTIPGYERNCYNCHHVEILICNKPCIECFRSSCELNCEMDNDYWEPRKEGE